jgi:aminomethyltransferase
VLSAAPAPAAPDLWEALLDAGILPAGLGARDTLRLEAGLPLHGHELGPGITPAQAGLDWVVAWGKGGFRGRDALDAERRRGVERILRGLEVEGRQPPRAGYKVLLDGAVVGEVTSGNFSPTLGRGIALAFLPPPLKAGASVSVDARGQRMPARVVYPPFVTGRRG